MTAQKRTSTTREIYLLPRMHGDAITKIVKDDEVFNKFGANLHEKLRKAGFPLSTSACG